MIQQRFDELDGDRYEILTPAAEALSARYPLATTLALRAMIDFTLNAGRSVRYQHTALHLAECDALVGQIEDFATFEPHASYVARLKRARPQVRLLGAFCMSLRKGDCSCY